MRSEMVPLAIAVLVVIGPHCGLVGGQMDVRPRNPAPATRPDRSISVIRISHRIRVQHWPARLRLCSKLQSWFIHRHLRLQS
jgi:hypothetical protein